MAYTLQAFTGFGTGDDLEFLDQTGTVYSFVDTLVRRNRYSIRFSGTAAGWVGLRPSNADGTMASTDFGSSTVYASFYIRFAAFPSTAEELAAFLTSGSTTQMSLYITSANKLAIYDNTGTLDATGATVLELDRWYRVDLKRSSSTGYELKLDNTIELTGSGGPYGTAVSGILQLGRKAIGSTVDHYISEAVVTTDDYFTVDPWYTGTLVPNGVGVNNAWASSTGSGDLYTFIDDIGGNDGDTTYVTDNTSGDQFSVDTSAAVFSLIKAPIMGVKQIHIGRKTGVSGSTQMLLVSGSTETLSTAAGWPGSTNYAGRALYYLTNPDTTAAWTVDEVGASEIGARSAVSATVRITLAVMTVLWGPKLRRQSLAYNWGG